MNSFTPPSFISGELELRLADDEIVIYGTPRGLSRLAELCMKLAKAPREQTQHYHLDDYELLTDDSLRGVLAVFDKWQA